ncbi:alpha-L-fucosidase [Enterococcus sp. AZ194]|uniref:alpha-L-fucosidase n=1 Tax=Enterococcus sp. AZ194 TaxID=2774629 RepID=UPI003F2978D0
MSTVKEMSAVRPETRQIAWQETAFYGFIHFGMNTMTDREWGLGDESLSLFNPADLDCRQWIQTLKKAGMKGAILTCKHHDGFCLWPTETTDYSIANTPFKQGQGDIVREFSTACQKEGLKFGVYLSPWDRHADSYGQGASYDELYAQQLTELLTNYGDVFEVWFDGATGAEVGKRQTYNWEKYFSCVRSLQPDAVMAVCGPDVRWIGNEAGKTRTDEWSVVPESLRLAERTIEKSQTVDDGKFGQAEVTSDAEDIGSQAVLEANQDPLIWYPAEVNTSIRPGWFYHAEEDKHVKSSEALFSIYKKSVGGNATFLLNVPPMKNGLISEVDQQVLDELGRKIKKLETNDCFSAAVVHLNGLIQQDDGFYADGKEGLSEIVAKWSTPQEISGVILQEDIRLGQQVEQYQIFSDRKGERLLLYEGNVLGYKKVATFPKVRTENLVIRIIKSRGPYRLKGLRVVSE